MAGNVPEEEGEVWAEEEPVDLSDLLPEDGAVLLVFWVLAGVVVVSVISSHASSKIRYFVVLPGSGISGASTKG